LEETGQMVYVGRDMHNLRIHLGCPRVILSIAMRGSMLPANSYAAPAPSATPGWMDGARRQKSAADQHGL
jgi:hypothetical protein